MKNAKKTAKRWFFASVSGLAGAGGSRGVPGGARGGPGEGLGAFLRDVEVKLT